MNEAFKFSLRFTFCVYLICNYFYQPLKKVTNEKNVEFKTAEYPVDRECKLTAATSQLELKRRAIFESVTRNHFARVEKERIKFILPAPTKTTCVSPEIIRQDLAPLIDLPRMPKLKKAITIAVIDTGIDLTNPYLSRRIKVPVSINNIHDLDFSSAKDLQDKIGHGSHVAGIIISIFPQAKILPIKYYNPKSSGLENLQASIKAIEFAIQEKVDIINYSNGGPEADEEELAVLKKAQAAGILVVTAAGNHRSDIDNQKNLYFPAAYSLDNIISVGNLSRSQTRSPSSNYGQTRVDLFAPGENILSYGMENENCLVKFTGTSQATPLVTATLALLKAANPNLKAPELKKILLQSVQINQNLISLSLTGGTLNINQSLASVKNFKSLIDGKPKF